MLNRPLLATLLFAIWLPGVAAGLVAMAHYERTPGASGRTPQHWPSSAGIVQNPSGATLLLFAHPRCPCTRASLGELSRLLTHCREGVTPHIVFFTPENAPPEWTETDLWQTAKAIPKAVVEADPGGKRARQFGVETSGDVVLYDARGELLFHGGITPGRGHAGDNSGESAIVALLSAQKVSTHQTPVFGCALLHSRGTLAPATSLCLKP